jgi:xanthine/uracil permease
MIETYAERMATSSPNRRRQRSVRVTVAVALLSVATLVVILALPTQSAGWLSASSVIALVCGFAAARIIYNELVQSRREAATAQPRHRPTAACSPSAPRSTPSSPPR